ncbi:response regulator [Sphingomonas sp.]|uniref:response regulator n=1 Tax=Sphingomonas sp. TaxID=28214 RepID=UPI003B00BC30
MPPPLFRFAGRALDGYRLLVAEDDVLTADALCATIRDAGGEVVGPTGSLADAVRLATCEPIDCAIVDMGLDGGQATPLVDLLLSEAVPIILATAAERDELPRAYWRLHLLRKPYSPATLVDCAMLALGDGGLIAPGQIRPASGLDGSA